jgi:biopolymer transport protein ExbB/TolQ
MSLYFGLQTLIDRQVITDELTLRYLTGHPVSKVTVAMFLVGAASLLVIANNIFNQFGSEKRISLQVPEQRETTDRSSSDNSSQTPVDAADRAIDLGQDLLDLPKRVHQHYLWNRLVNALHYIYRTGSVAGVEDEMKYLADIDLDRQQQRYSLVRILIWATPMLGFLGTVLGISQALGGIAVGPENDFQQMMDGLRSSLYVAFDTTALALTLSMVLMFVLFLVDRFESQLLIMVDQRSQSEIARQFDLTAAGIAGSPNAAFLDALKNSATEQTEIWRKSIRAAEEAWTASLSQTSDIVRTGLTESLDENVASLAHYLGESIEKADLSMSNRWEQWQVTLSDNARKMEKYQQQLAEQTTVVKSILEKAEDSGTFKSAMAEHEKAMKATVRTHDVLTELSKSISNAKMLQDLASHSRDTAAFVENIRSGKEELSTDADVTLVRPKSDSLVELNQKSVLSLVSIQPKDLEDLVSGEVDFKEVSAAIVDSNPSTPDPNPEVSWPAQAVNQMAENHSAQSPPAEPTDKKADVAFVDRFKKKDKKVA